MAQGFKAKADYEDLVAVRTGMPIVVDGIIESGIAMVNQASLTGAPLAIERTAGDEIPLSWPQA